MFSRIKKMLTLLPEDANRGSGDSDCHVIESNGYWPIPLDSSDDESSSEQQPVRAPSTSANAPARHMPARGEQARLRRAVKPLARRAARAGRVRRAALNAQRLNAAILLPAQASAAAAATAATAATAAATAAFDQRQTRSSVQNVAVSLVQAQSQAVRRPGSARLVRDHHQMVKAHIQVQVHACAQPPSAELRIQPQSSARGLEQAQGLKHEQVLPRQAQGQGQGQEQDQGQGEPKEGQGQGQQPQGQGEGQAQGQGQGRGDGQGQAEAHGQGHAEGAGQSQSQRQGVGQQRSDKEEPPVKAQIDEPNRDEVDSEAPRRSVRLALKRKREEN